jgi:phospholipid N-methyltransferase
MRRRLSQYGLFFRQFLTNCRTTGAVLPSGRFLGHALSRFVRHEHAGARRILEVGPGTGSVTRLIARAMGPDDRLDLVELNESFVRCLEDRLQTDEAFRPLAGRARVLHCSVQGLHADGAYDLIISGLPLNNFSVPEVEQVLVALTGLLKPGGTLSFFEYIAIRRMRALLSGPADRARLRGIGEALESLLREHEVRRDWIWPNVPPAWVHHVRL